MKKSSPYKHNLKRNWIFAYSKWMAILLAFLLTVCYSLFTVSYAAPPKRIVSLAPSITEILFATGLGDRVVGVTTFCDYPEEAKKKPKIGGMSNPSLEAVVTLRPDLVVLTTDGNPKEFEHKLRSVGIKTYVFKSLTLADLPKGIRDMGIALDAKDRFDTLASKIEQAINRFRDQGSKVGNQKVSINHASRMTHYALPRKKVLFIIWPQPLIVAGPRTAIHDAITLLGGINIAGKAKSRYPRFSLEEVIRQAPDIIFIGKGHEDIEELSSILLKRLSMVPAVKNKKVFYVSDSLYRLGPRIIDGIEELARYLLKK